MEVAHDEARFDRIRFPLKVGFYAGEQLSGRRSVDASLDLESLKDWLDRGFVNDFFCGRLDQKAQVGFARRFPDGLGSFEGVQLGEKGSDAFSYLGASFEKNLLVDRGILQTSGLEEVPERDERAEIFQGQHEAVRVMVQQTGDANAAKMRKGPASLELAEDRSLD